MHLRPWIEAMRLRTLPVSTAGVLTGCAVAIAYGSFKWLPALICLVFAIMAQIVSNFANEYFDYKYGLDKRGRQGFRRGVTEGDITPGAMKKAMVCLMAVNCLIGLSLVYWGGYWLIAVGLLIAIAAFAYSAGPWPLSHHGLGDEAVVIFYGLVPVTLTAYVQCGADWTGGYMKYHLGEMWIMAVLAALGIGLLGANVLTVNNIRDVKDDKKVGKYTKAVTLGVSTMRFSYILLTYAGLALIWFAFRNVLTPWGWTGYAAIAIWFIPVIWALFKYSDSHLNAVLKYTALLLLVTAVWSITDILLVTNAM